MAIQNTILYCIFINRRSRPAMKKKTNILHNNTNTIIVFLYNRTCSYLLYGTKTSFFLIFHPHYFLLPKDQVMPGMCGDNWLNQRYLCSQHRSEYRCPLLVSVNTWSFILIIITLIVSSQPAHSHHTSTGGERNGNNVSMTIIFAILQLLV